MRLHGALEFADEARHERLVLLERVARYHFEYALDDLLGVVLVVDAEDVAQAEHVHVGLDGRVGAKAWHLGEEQEQLGVDLLDGVVEHHRDERLVDEKELRVHAEQARDDELHVVAYGGRRRAVVEVEAAAVQVALDGLNDRIDRLVQVLTQQRVEQLLDVLLALLDDLIDLLVLVLGDYRPDVGQYLALAQTQIVVQVEQELATAQLDKRWQRILAGDEARDALEEGVQYAVEKHGYFARVGLVAEQL